MLLLDRHSFSSIMVVLQSTAEKLKVLSLEPKG
jgi:hypothetical protein